MGELLTLAQAATATSAEATDWLPTWGVVFLLFVGLVAFSYGTRAGIIARATTKEAIRQPLFFLLIAIATIVLLLNLVMPFFTLGEGDDTKMLKDCGLYTLLVAGTVLAVWTAGTSITSEIEGKTAMTLLSKPINRRQFILGKYIGIVQAVLWLFAILSVIFLLCVFYKIGYDAKEQAREVPPALEWREITKELEIPLPHPVRMVQVNSTWPGIALAFLQVCVIGAVSVMLATRVPVVVNLACSFACFVIGNLSPVIVQHSEKNIQNEFVTFTARLIAIIMPALDAFNISAAVATGTEVPPAYLGYGLLYAVAYSSAAIVLGLLLFEDRDLA